MNPTELLDCLALLNELRSKVVTGEIQRRLTESIRVVERELKLQTTDYVRGTRIPIFKNEEFIEPRTGKGSLD